METLLTTQEAAEQAGVGPTAIKRWADLGLLPCVKTAGGHRRFRQSELVSFMKHQSTTVAEPQHDEADAWTDRLLAAESGHETEAELLRVRGQAGSWHRAAPFVGEVLVRLGRRWERGELSVIQEHIASERLRRGLTRISETVATSPDAPLVLLTTVEGDDHVLGLALVELCLREAGLRTRWAGHNTPIDDVISFIGDGSVEMVAVSASSASSDKRALERWARRLGAACAEHSVELVLGGEGPWPEPPRVGTRVRTFDELHAYLAGRQQRTSRRRA